jgi:hypothetical protein
VPGSFASAPVYLAGKAWELVSTLESAQSTQNLVLNIFFDGCMHLSFVSTEIDKLNWVLSVHVMRSLLLKGVLGHKTPPVNLLLGDAVKVFDTKHAFAFRSKQKHLPSTKNVLVFFWDRGFGPARFAQVANAALRSPQVAGDCPAPTFACIWSLIP